MADSQPAVVTASTLKGAYKKVKAEFGDDAVILGSRTVTKRQPDGLGHEKIVEVMVQDPGGHTRKPESANQIFQALGQSVSHENALQNDMETEVERIEELVRSITRDFDKLDPSSAIIRNNPLAESLVNGGADPRTITKLLTRFTSETGHASNDRVAALSWLGESLKASNCDWEGFYGCHAFLGSWGTGQSEMILATASRLQELGRRTLVLNVMPENRGQIRQLQVEASQSGFDAAVIQKPRQLTKSEEHLKRYDVVLVDMPNLDHSAMVTGGVLHGWLATNATFHRHMLISSNQDPRDMNSITMAAKNWNCDWLGLTRMEQTGLPAKILDFSDINPLPISLMENSGKVEIATSGKLLDFILGQSNHVTSGNFNQSAKG
ncbi:MAG: hypothetical protein GY780_10925 [bacterium]|nr:hypothetical protein [bacterium]